jgi:transcriptional regulator with XRE-family HTH domain
MRSCNTKAGVEDAVAQFADNLASARQRLQIMQEDVSGRSGVHPTEVSRIENGERDVRVSTVFRLAAALEVSPGQLLDGLT